ncbi:DUF222 domain-containing protein [Nakamurella sp. PAMC28650]|uniref:DUF222 domain-containing protein n=1 Tax=Nakamurella sp. PAMC28650 TaxID=2762325 RepID=UPI00164E492C|nr:DUF222 domain-containing protein [Nakamurella sp. PAMC28650]QNK82632.1 DUF222 domain-containing protein [Nakamurella sp. PAMC28650]
MLAGALEARAVGAEQVRTIAATMGTLPTAMPILEREWWEKFLVEQAGALDPRQLDQVAAAVLDAADPDGTLDETQTRTRMEFSWGSRNARTGRTGRTGLTGG